MPDIYFSPKDDLEEFIRPAERAAIPSTLGETFGAAFAKGLSNSPTLNFLDLVLQNENGKSLHDSFFEEINAFKTDTVGALLYRYNQAFDLEPTEEQREQRKQTQEQIDDVLSRAPDGLLSGFSRIAGSTIAFLADPINIGASIVAPELVGARAASTLSGLAARRLSTGVSSIIGRVGGGAAEGAAIVAPGEAVEAFVSNKYDEDFNSLEFVANIGIGAALGSIAGFFHLKEAAIKGISTEGAQQATQDAVSQMASGNSIDVSVPIKKGFKDQRLKDNITVEDVRREREEVLKEIDKHNLNRDKFIKEEIEPLKNEELKERLPIADLHERISRIQSKLPEHRFPIEQDILRNFEKTKEFKNLEDILSQPAEVIDSSLIKRGEQSFKKEIESLNQRIEDNNASVSQLRQIAEDTTLKKIERREAETEMNRIKRQIEVDTSRINLIENGDRSTPVEDTLKKFDQFSDNETHLINKLDDLNTLEEMLTASEQGLTGEDIKKYGHGTLNGEKESGINLNDDSLKREAETVNNEGRELREDEEQAVDKLFKAGELPEDIMGEIEAIKDEIDSLPKYNQIIDEIGDCILKNVV